MPTRISIPGFALVAAVVVGGAVVTGQPPPEFNLHVLIDVGPIPVSIACDCISAPFTLPRSRPGYGYGDGPASPAEDAPLSKAERSREARRIAEERKSLQTNFDDGLRGNPNASFAIALLFVEGKVVKRNDEAAAQWLLLAAAQEHPDAFALLGYRYIRGLGVPQDDTAAAYWFHASATHGRLAGLLALGSLYAGGRGVPQDWSQAVKWWRKAPPGVASRFLGDAYVCGLGVEKNNERAMRLYRAGAEAGEISNTIQLGYMHARGCAPEPIEEAAFDAFKRAADQGYPEAQIELSELYRTGRGTDVNPYYAYFWARMAERRLPNGELRSRAASRAAVAAQLLPAVIVKDADSMVATMIAAGSKPMNR